MTAPNDLDKFQNWLATVSLSICGVDMRTTSIAPENLQED